MQPERHSVKLMPSAFHMNMMKVKKGEGTAPEAVQGAGPGGERCL